MEILIYLFIIGIMLMIILYVGSILLAPILVAGSFFGLIFGAIIKLIVGFFELFGFTLRKVSEFETGKTQEEQMNNIKNNKPKTKEEKWEELVGDNNVTYETKVETPSKNKSEESHFVEEKDVTNMYLNGKLPPGFFDEI